MYSLLFTLNLSKYLFNKKDPEINLIASYRIRVATTLMTIKSYL
ncbi:hypothetical protein SAMN05421827_11696 [Pedobacter terrae]|uniref:Uncharacterized protein n=1 Tax=Pedobacter terrae TaxID=405671 RepID=A0A1G7ZLH2_9SPHI|nr:hypothetical protein SAMN05421827_11696 [Pedobacter terrae]